MFTGIIEEIGHVKRMLSGGIIIKAKKVLEDVNIGDSIAVNGVCLTVTSYKADEFTVDVMPETLRCTNLGSLKPESRVNLERAMAANGRFGGHIVSGHIDTCGTIADLRRENNAVIVEIKTPANILKNIVKKGSIAIDGISLTVAYVKEDGFAVSIIPHTGQQTILLNKKKHDTVNLECDVIGKYVENFVKYYTDSQNNICMVQDGYKTSKYINPDNDNMHSKKPIDITMDFLSENGFF